MAFASNPIDGVRTYYEDDGGEGPAVVVYGGLMQSIDRVRTWLLAKALAGKCRLVFADHRGHGRSDKPLEVSAYSGVLRAADFAAVLNDLGIERAHLLGYSWGARLGFSVGEHQPQRVISLILGGHQPYRFRTGGPVVSRITERLELARETGMQAMVVHIESSNGAPMAVEATESMLANDAAAVHAAWHAALEEGDVSADLTTWSLPCLIYAGEHDVDFFEQAQRAASEIPGARFIGLSGADHFSGHAEVDRVLPTILEILSAP